MTFGEVRRVRMCQIWLQSRGLDATLKVSTLAVLFPRPFSGQRNEVWSTPELCWMEEACRIAAALITLPSKPSEICLSSAV